MMVNLFAVAGGLFAVAGGLFVSLASKGIGASARAADKCQQLSAEGDRLLFLKGQNMEEQDKTFRKKLKAKLQQWLAKSRAQGEDPCVAEDYHRFQPYDEGTFNGDDGPCVSEAREGRRDVRAVQAPRLFSRRL